ncbi:MAG: hypothetical protein WC558_15255 [Patulibacter sp.]
MGFLDDEYEGFQNKPTYDVWVWTQRSVRNRTETLMCGGSDGLQTMIEAKADEVLNITGIDKLLFSDLLLYSLAIVCWQQAWERFVESQ